MAAIAREGRGALVVLHAVLGPDGVQVVGSRSRGEAFALKIMDGNMVAQVAAAVEVMDQLGWLDAAQQEALAPRRNAVICKAKGLAVGGRRPVFRLQRATA